MIEMVKRAAQSVYNEMGSGHTEAVYENCLALEIGLNGKLLFPIIRQVPVTISFKGFTVGVGFIDILLDNIIVELKTVAKITPKDVQQVRKYLEALDLAHGILINFGNDLEIIEVKAGKDGTSEGF